MADATPVHARLVAHVRRRNGPLSLGRPNQPGLRL